jgi:ABC-type polysaccharide/polyol phosphate export permease
MVEHLRELFRYRELLRSLTWREIRVKYKQSIMGVLWAVFMPMIVVSAGILVKYAAAKLSGSAFDAAAIASISIRAVPWAFFVSSLRFATGSLISNTNLVTRIYFPKEIFPLAAVLSQLLDFMVASGVLLVLLTVVKVGVSVHLLWVPVLMLLMILLVAGLGIFLSASALFFRDVKYLVEVVLTFAIFFTPVFYDVSLFGKWSKVLLLNPVAPLLEGIDAVIVKHQEPQLAWVLYSTVFALVVLTAGYSFFKRSEPAFAENI